MANVSMATMHRRAAALCLILVLPACSRSELPAVPALDTSSFLPAVRTSLEQARKELDASPEDPEKNGLLGMRLHTHDRLQAALICYQRAHLLAPGEHRWNHYLGLVHSATANYSLAAESFRRAVKIRPDYLASRLGLAEALLAASDTQTARQLFEQILATNPQSPIAHYGAGRAYSAEGNADRAASAYAAACRLFPSYGAARYALALASRQLGREDEARRHLALYEQNRTGTPPPEDPLLVAVHGLNAGVLPLLAKAKAVAGVGDWQQALLLHQQALAIDPRHEQAHINLVSLYGRTGQFELAEHHYREALALNPKRDETHYNFAVLLNSRGRVKESIASYRQALALNPAHPEANNNLAALLAAAGQLDEALRLTERALAQRPAYPQAHFNAAAIELRRRRLPEAIQHLEAAAQAQDDNLAHYLHVLASAHAKAGSPQKALAIARQAHSAAQTRRQAQFLAQIERDFPQAVGIVSK
jgi:protein O-GlcNAc transferase